MLKQECKCCKSLTTDHKPPLATQNYKLKKEKKSKTTGNETFTMVDSEPFYMIGAVKSPEKWSKRCRGRKTTPSKAFIGKYPIKIGCQVVRTFFKA